MTSYRGILGEISWRHNIKKNDIRYNDTQHAGFFVTHSISASQHNEILIVPFFIVMLGVAFTKISIPTLSTES